MSGNGRGDQPHHGPQASTPDMCFFSPNATPRGLLASAFPPISIHPQKRQLLRIRKTLKVREQYGGWGYAGSLPGWCRGLDRREEMSASHGTCRARDAEEQGRGRGPARQDPSST